MIAVVLLYVQTARAEMQWQKPYPAVKVLTKQFQDDDGTWIRFHAAIVDLSQPGVQVVVSPPKYRGNRTSKFAEKIGAQVALNGGFWKLVSKAPIGHVVSAGRPWKDCVIDERYGYLAITRKGKAWIQPPGETKLAKPEKAWMVISGMPLIVDQGKIGKVRGCGYVCMEHPRSAVGISQDGWTLYLAVSEGRVEGSKSIRPKRMAQFLIELGAWQALNLDGGGSSTLYVDKLGGMINAPAEGKERSVLNHIGVIIGEPPEPEAPAEEADAPEVHVPAPIMFTEDDFVPRGQVENPPRVMWSIYGGAAGALLLTGLITGIVITLRRRRRG